MEQDNNRIANKTWVGLSFLALFADLLTLIPIVGDIVGPVFWVGISYYFWKKGLGLFNWRRFTPEIISFIAELVPGIQELPSIFVGMIAITLLTKFEQKTGINPINLAKGKITPPRIVRKPLNSGGMRQPNKNNQENLVTEEIL